MRTLVLTAAACVGAVLACGGIARAAEPAAAEKVTGEPGKVMEYVYKKTPQGELKMHVHFPADWKAGDQRPAIVFFFGGAWRAGTVDQFKPQAEYLASRGMVAARADYRVQSRHGTTPVASVEDAKSAVRWLRQRAGDLGIDPARLAGSGGSAGGHIAACAAMTDTLDARDEDKSVSSRPNALVLFNPVLDLTNLDIPGQKAEALGGPEALKAISPILYVKKDTPPAVLFYGTEDRFLAHGRALLAKSKELGNRVEVYAAAGLPHGFFNRPPWTEITLRQADLFLVSLGYLKGDPTIQPPPGSTQELKKEP